MTKWRASYLTPDEELLERLRKDHGENAIVSVRYFEFLKLCPWKCT